jgi:transcriptional regulator with XRE-family HTH domain
MDVSLRIKEFCDRKNIKQIELVDRGIGAKQTVNNIFKSKQKPSYDFILKLLTEYNEIDARWLITGEGEMFRFDKTSTDSEIINEPVNDYSKKCNKCREQEIEIRILNRSLKDKEERIYELQKAVGALEQQLQGGNDSNGNGSIPKTG